MEFILPIDAAKFRSTNAIWNTLMLNDPWSVGYVTTLIELVPFATKEEWEQFYYDSGAERETRISTLSSDIQKTLQDESLVRTDKSLVVKMGYDLKNLNTQFGRTKECLHHKAELLYDSVRNNGLGLTIDECVECVRFRVICETWNGVIVRERNTLQTLKKSFPDVEFKKVTGEMDHTYAVDCELYKEGKLTAAIQIKPQSYTWNAPYIQKARNANQYKNQEYLKRYGVKVFDVIADSSGNIVNEEVLRDLEGLLS